MVKKFGVFFLVAFDLVKAIISTFRKQSMSRGYLIGLAVFWVAIIFAFVSLNPALYSFIYPLF